ncbi:YqjF family protein [Rubrobacter indicoceani]|uniref:YqjF family protein n=1 Tax=Rubrobacter indicoceani TaxID=2051957 RepID=UPI001969961A|nr:DUF2071 domain-containing protein [Rubrobacter indicoceani]
MGFNAEKLLSEVDHRLYPRPDGPWAMSMTWHDLLFMHWPVPVEVLRPMIPAGLQLDTFDGSAWLGVVPFRMSDVRPRFLPSVGPVSNFPEINLRTYVTADDRPGVWFFSLDAHNSLAVRLARATFGLPYFDATMSLKREDDTVHYRSRRAPLAEFSGSYRPTAGIERSHPHTIEAFLTERYCLYAPWGKTGVRRGEVHHELWPLRKAEAEVETLQMTEQVGITLPDTEPVLHFAERLEVLAWVPENTTDRKARR